MKDYNFPLLFLFFCKQRNVYSRSSAAGSSPPSVVVQGPESQASWQTTANRHAGQLVSVQLIFISLWYQINPPPPPPYLLPAKTPCLYILDFELDLNIILLAFVSTPFLIMSSNWMFYAQFFFIIFQTAVTCILQALRNYDLWTKILNHYPNLHCTFSGHWSD